ncbi:hypothetical protein C6P42_001184, partial [Pichia californica]
MSSIGQNGGNIIGREMVGSDISSINPLTKCLFIPLFILYIVVLSLVTIGFTQIRFYFNKKSQLKLVSFVDEEKLESVTILRPLKGVDSNMICCLESSFQQEYPINKLEIIFCVQSETDPAIPMVKQLIQKYKNIDSKLMIDENQNKLDFFGSNPKVNNLHKGYKAAKYDILWVLDSNIYTDPHTLKRSIYTLQNDMSNGSKNAIWLRRDKTVKMITHVPIVSSDSKHRINWGSRLDEMFMSTSHAKFYVALNRIQPAPCINGKSNIYRRSDLDRSVEIITKQMVKKGEGMKHFAKYIGEDHMIAMALFESVDGCAGMSMDFVLQPISGQNSVREYIHRRARWLRIRKYMVAAATFLEPTTESILNGLIGSFAINVLFRERIGVYWSWFYLHMIAWYIIDLFQFKSIVDATDNSKIQREKFNLFHKKLPRTNLEQKIMIIDYFKKSNKPQSETVEHFKDKYSISTSSFSEWLRHEDELRKRYSNATYESNGISENIKNSKRKSTFKYGPINDAMHKIVIERINNDLPVTEPILRHYWSKFAKEYGILDPKRADCFSHGWLANFKKRHGLIKMKKSKSDESIGKSNKNKITHTKSSFSLDEISNDKIDGSENSKLKSIDKIIGLLENEKSSTYDPITNINNSNNNDKRHQPHLNHHKNYPINNKRRKVNIISNLDYLNSTSSTPNHTYNNYDIQSQMQLSQFLDNNIKNSNFTPNLASSKTVIEIRNKLSNTNDLDSPLISSNNKNDKNEILSLDFPNNKPRLELDIPSS